MPSRISTRLSTVANTGRRMQNSNRLMSRPFGRRRRSPGIHNLDGHAVAQLELTGGHDLHIGGKPLKDLDLGASPLAELHLRFDGFAALDAEYECLAAARHDGALRRQHDLARLLALDQDPGEQAWPQREIGIGQPGPQLQRAPIHVDLWIDGIDLAAERAPRQRIDHHVYGLSDIDGRQEQLRKLEVDFQEVDLLQVHDWRTDGNEGAGRYLADSDAASERCLDRVLGEPYALQFKRSPRDLEVGSRLVDRFFRHVASARKLLGSLIVGLG